MEREDQIRRLTISFGPSVADHMTDMDTISATSEQLFGSSSAKTSLMPADDE